MRVVIARIEVAGVHLRLVRRGDGYEIVRSVVREGVADVQRRAVTTADAGDAFLTTVFAVAEAAARAMRAQAERHAFLAARRDGFRASSSLRRDLQRRADARCAEYLALGRACRAACLQAIACIADAALVAQARPEPGWWTGLEQDIETIAELVERRAETCAAGAR